MPTFNYTAVLKSGERLKSRADASDTQALQKELEDKGHVVLAIAAQRTFGRRTHRSSDSLAFLRGLASLTASGVSLSASLDMTREMVPPGFVAVVGDVQSAVSRGSTLAAALSIHDRTFTRVTTAMISAGEQSGQLAESLRNVVLHLEREAAFRSRILSASVYPLVLAVAGVATLSVLLIFVLPRFAELIQSGGGDLPALAGMLLTLHAVVKDHHLALSLTIISTLACIISGLRTRRGKRLLSTASYTLPVLRGLRRGVIGARFTRSLGMLIAGGTPIVVALGGTAACMLDLTARDAVERVQRDVRGGQTLRHAVRSMWFLPTVALQLIAVGERSGDLASHLLMSADILERDVERRMDRLMILAEPAMILVFGGLIGFVALALLQAVYGMQGGVWR